MRFWIFIIGITLCKSAFGLDEVQLAELLTEARIEMEMPGVRAAVRYAGGPMVLATSGLADVEANILLDNAIGMPGGSTGKTFVAALTMLLVEDDALSLDDLAGRWLGELDWYNRLPNSESIRVHHLLAHTSGISDYPATAGFQTAMIWRVLRNGSAKFEPEELIAYVDKKKAAFPPGEGFRYTDVGYLVLGRLIEAASGRTYYDLLKERILIPQGLDEVRVADQSVLTNITPGYMLGSRNIRKDGRMKFDPSSEWTGGGLITNPRMLAQFFGVLAESGVVKLESFTRMLEAGWRDPDSPGEHYGLGVFVWDDGKSFGHSGLWPGYRSYVKHALQSGITVALQTNRDGRVDMESLVDRILSAAKKEMPGKEKADSQGTRPRRPDKPGQP